MKRLAIIALLFLSPFTSATEIEEVVVKAPRIVIALEKLAETHKKNPVTGNWHYIEKKESRKRA
jgi:hypothetical protein